MSRLCLCLTSSDPQIALEQIALHRELAEMAEWRVDLVDPDKRRRVFELSAKRSPRLPLLLTIRLTQDRGRWGAGGETEEEREDLLRSLVSSGEWSWVDLEHERPMGSVVDAAERTGTGIVRSLHDFEGTLLDRPVPELARLVRRMARNGAVPKVAIRCKGSRHLLALARLSIAVSDIAEKVLIGMDEYGAPSRILAERFGSLWTYSSPADAGPGAPLAAPGQLDPTTLRRLYRFGEITDATPLYAVVGNPVAHSQSPEIHNGWLRSGNLPGTYLPIRADDMDALLETCDILGITGLSVTVPHKEKALELCEYAGDLARRISASNTLVRGGDGWRGRNTDAGGFLKDLGKALGAGGNLDLTGRRVLVIGAGGAARAAAHALSGAGARIVVLNRTGSKAERLASETGGIGGPLESGSLKLLRNVDIAVQTTTVGMHPEPDADPIPWWDFQGCSLVYDMIYEPSETLLLKRAASSGVGTWNGAGMLEAQAELQFEIFTGRKPKRKVQAPRTLKILQSKREGL